MGVLYNFFLLLLCRFSIVQNVKYFLKALNNKAHTYKTLLNFDLDSGIIFEYLLCSSHHANYNDG